MGDIRGMEATEEAMKEAKVDLAYRDPCAVRNGTRRTNVYIGSRKSELALIQTRHVKQLLETAEQTPDWHLIMMSSLLAMIPPIIVVLSMQKLFVKGLTETEK